MCTLLAELEGLKLGLLQRGAITVVEKQCTKGPHGMSASLLEDRSNVIGPGLGSGFLQVESPLDPEFQPLCTSGSAWARCHMQPSM